MEFPDHDVTPGEGCRAVPGRAVVCGLEGIDRFRIVGGDGDDFIAFKAALPVIADLGPGDDELRGQAPAVTISAGEGDDTVGLGVPAGMVDLGPGRDQVDAELHWAWEGSTPLRLAGGDGDDRITAQGRKRGVTLSGGRGDDRIVVNGARDMHRVDITCGPGADQLLVSYVDRTGDGCAPHLEGVTPGTVSRTFTEGRLSAAGAGSVTIRRRVRNDFTPREFIARGRFDADAGPLRVRLHTTPTGRRWLRRDPTLPLFVYARTRKGEDRTVIRFWSRLG